jgi:phosphatidylserine decarboxylase
LTLACAVLAYRFYRDPERTAPDRDDVIVSPADGKVIYIRKSEGGKLPGSTKHGRDYTLQELTKTPLCSEDAFVIGIAMSFLDVHINRAPMAGSVTLVRHYGGRFGSLKQPAMVFENERTTTVIERGDLQVAVVQIASRLVRQIVSFVREGQDVAVGQRIGVIRLGSQVDVVLPIRDDVKVAVQVGMRVKAGESILATSSKPPSHWSGARAAARRRVTASRL